MKIHGEENLNPPEEKEGECPWCRRSTENGEYCDSKCFTESNED